MISLEVVGFLRLYRLIDSDWTVSRVADAD